MPFVIAQWTCRTCKGTHRVRYPIVTNNQAYSKAENIWEWNGGNGVKIADPACLIDLKGKKRDCKTRKYALIVDSLASLPTIIETLRIYLYKYYTIEEKTLIVELCDDGE